jgi:WD40 repeat protein
VKHFPSLRALQEGHRALLQRRRDAGELDPELQAEIEDFIEKGRQTGRILRAPADQSAAQGLLDYWAAVLYRESKDRDKDTLSAVLAEYDPSTAQDSELGDDEYPYVGLRSFSDGKADCRVFFGRDKLVRDMFRLIERGNFVAVLGRPSSGRSSLVHAGLLARLKRGELPGSETWPVLAVTPPLERQLAKIADAPTSVIVVDDTDEVFATSSREKQQQFADDVLKLADAPGIRRIVVLVLQSEYTDLFAQLPALQARIQQAQVRVQPPTAKELRQAIEGPAELVGLHFEEGVVDALVYELVGEHAAFALLQFTLMRLWQRRVRNNITREALQAVGIGVEALARAAEEFYRPLPDDKKPLARAVLVRLGSNEKRVAIPLRSLADSTDNPQAAEAILNAMEQAGLVSVTRREGCEPVVKLTHWSLGEKWKPLAEWLSEEKEDLERAQRLEDKAREWTARDRPSDVDLLTELELLEAEKWLESPAARRIASDDARALVKVTRWRRRRVLLRWQALSGALLAMAILFAVAATWAVLQTTRAVHQTTRAEAARRDLSVQLEVSQLFSIERSIADIEPKAASRETFARQLDADAARAAADQKSQIEKEAERVKRDREAFVTQLKALSAERRKRIGSINIDNKARWERTNQGEKQQILDKVRGLLSPDPTNSRCDRLLVALYAAAAIPENDSELNRLLGDSLTNCPVPVSVLDAKSPVWAVAYSPSGDRSLAAVGDNTGLVQLWDPLSKDSAETKKFPVSGGTVNGLAFTIDGRWLAAAYRAVGAAVWSIDNLNHPICTIGARANHESREPENSPSPRIWDVAFFPDKKTLAVASSDHKTYLWDVSESSCKLLGQIAGHTSDVLGVAVSPDGRLLATASADGTVVVWRLEPGREPQVYRRFSTGQPVFAVAFDRNSRLLAASGASDRGYIWDVETEKVTRLPSHQGLLGRVIFSPNGELVATAGTDKVAIVASVNGNELHRFPHEKEVFGVAFSADSKHLLTGSLDGKARFWALAKVQVTGDREVLIVHGAKRFPDKNLTGEQCSELRKLGVPLFMITQEDWASALPSNTTSCPLPFLEPDPAKAP